MIMMLVRGVTLARVDGTTWSSPDKDLERYLNAVCEGQGSSPAYPTVEDTMVALATGAGVSMRELYHDPVPPLDPDVVY